MSWRRQVAKLGALFRRRKPVDDLAEEIRFHLEMEEQENLESGMPPDEAHYLLDRSDLEQVINAFSAGAKGVACQTDPFEVLCKCIRCVHSGQVWANSRELQWVVKTLGDREPVHVVSAKGIPLLTRREEQVVSMAVEGLPNHEIAVKLGVSQHTVKNHLFRIYEKLGISNRVELHLYATSSQERSRGSSITTRGDA